MVPTAARLDRRRKGPDSGGSNPAAAHIAKRRRDGNNGFGNFGRNIHSSLIETI